MVVQAKGTKAYLAIQEEGAGYNLDPLTPASTKIYFETETISKTLARNSSAIIRGNRNAVSPTRGNIDITGAFTTELMAGLGTCLYGVCGSIATTANGGAGEVLATALVAPTGVIDADNQRLTITEAAHGITLGDVILLSGLTSPTSLNGLYCRVVSVPDSSHFVLRIPTNTSTIFTLGTGSMQKVTTPATTYEHTIKVGSALPSFVIEKGFSDIGQFFKYNGCKFSKMQLEVSASGPQKMTFDIMGGKETVSTTAYAAATDPGKASFDGLDIAILEEGGAAVATVSSISGLSFDNGLDGATFLLGGGGSRASINDGLVKISGTLKALFSDTALYNKAITDTTSSLRIGYQRGTGTGVAANESIEFKIPELLFDVKTPVVSAPGGLWVELGFTGFFQSSAEASSMQVILKNSQLYI